MPLKENDKNIDYKTRMERKLWLARENPEPIFDLSECNLKTVPANIYSLCKVFRKNALYLQKNKLSSLSGGGNLEDLISLTVLDISSNSFTKLPSNLCILSNLKVLNVSVNQIKELPENIGDLKSLLHLNASNNQLKNLPITIGGCINLEYMNIQGNKNLKELPTSLGKLQCLNELIIDSEMIYPQPEICKAGVHAILKYLAEECGEDYKPLEVEVFKPNKKIPQEDSFNLLQEKIRNLEKLKEEKQKELLALEEQLQRENREEIKSHQLLREMKKELITVVKNQQQSLDEEISKVHQMKESRRALLIKECNDAEESANLKIKQLLENKNRMRERLAKSSEREKREEDLLLGLRQRNYEVAKPMEKEDLLVSMNELLKEEIKKAENQSKDKRAKFIESIISEDKQHFEELRACMRKFDENQTQLIESISQNEDLQRSAVSSLLERSDARLWYIKNQVASVEAQLTALTQLELARKKLKTETHLAELAQSRMILTSFLMDLFHDQSERRKQLIESLRKVENTKLESTENFWLEQYQKLLQSNSQRAVELLKSLDVDLVNEFFAHGVFHYLPLLGGLTDMSIEEMEKLSPSYLSSIGIVSGDDEEQILKAIEAYTSSKRVKPSAPPGIEASAPPMSPSSSYHHFKNSITVNDECVVCMDLKADTIFVPCGHTCFCLNCSASLSACPLCRTSIKHILPFTSSSDK